MVLRVVEPESRVASRSKVERVNDRIAARTSWSASIVECSARREPEMMMRRKHGMLAPQSCGALALAL